MIGPNEDGRRRFVHDEGQPGLVLAITPSGARSWYCWCRVRDSGFEKVSIGRWPTVSVVDARDAARSIAGQASQGVSPTAARKQARDAEARRARAADQPTFEETYRWFLSLPKKTRKVARPRSPRTIKGYESIWKNHLTKYGGRRMDAIGVEDVLTLRNHVREASGPYQANRVLALVSAVYEAARKRSEAEGTRYRFEGANPAERVDRFPETCRVDAGKGRLPDTTLARMFNAIREEAIATDNQDAADMLEIDLLLGNRIGRVYSMRWGEIDLEERVWVQADDSNKQRRTHVVPLPPRVVEILERRRGKHEDWVFPAKKRRTRRDGTTTEHMGYPGKFWQRAKTRAGLENMDIRPHDFRHTAASRMHDDGTPILDIAEALGHASIATTQKYLRADRRRVRAGLTRAAEGLGSIIGEREEGAA